MDGPETATAAGGAGDRVGVGVGVGVLRTAGLHPSAVGHGGAACLIGGAGDAAPTVPADIPAAGDREL